MLNVLAGLVDGQVFAFLLAFTRLASMLSLIPALGDATISVNIRMVLAFLLSIIAVVTLPQSFPAEPSGLAATAGIVIGEISIGLFFGVLLRFLLSAIHVAGNIIALEIGLAAAQSFDPSQQGQSALVASFMNMLAITMIFLADLHQPMLRGMLGTFITMPPGAIPDIGNTMELAGQVFSRSFLLGTQLSIPFLVYGMVFNIGLGLVARLMPQLQVFFIAMPINIYLGFAILMLTIGAILTAFLTAFQDGMSQIMPWR